MKATDVRDGGDDRCHFILFIIGTLRDKDATVNEDGCLFCSLSFSLFCLYNSFVSLYLRLKVYEHRNGKLNLESARKSKQFMFCCLRSFEDHKIELFTFPFYRRRRKDG